MKTMAPVEGHGHRDGLPGRRPSMLLGLSVTGVSSCSCKPRLVIGLGHGRCTLAVVAADRIPSRAPARAAFCTRILGGHK